MKTRPTPPGITDLTGLTFGLVTVVGFTDDDRARWLVRCACGYEDIRTTKALVPEVRKPNHRCTAYQPPTIELELESPAPEPTIRKVPERGVCGKMRFSSEKMARKAIVHRLNRGSNCNKLRAYFCKPCKAWHMTSLFK